MFPPFDDRGGVPLTPQVLGHLLFQSRLEHCLVIGMSSPSGPVRCSPLARGLDQLTHRRSASADVAVFFASLDIMPLSVPVIGDHPSSPNLVGVSSQKHRSSDSPRLGVSDSSISGPLVE